MRPSLKNSKGAPCCPPSSFQCREGQHPDYTSFRQSPQNPCEIAVLQTSGFPLHTRNRYGIIKAKSIRARIAKNEPPESGVSPGVRLQAHCPLPWRSSHLLTKYVATFAVTATIKSMKKSTHTPPSRYRYGEDSILIIPVFDNPRNIRENGGFRNGLPLAKRRKLY